MQSWANASSVTFNNEILTLFKWTALSHFTTSIVIPTKVTIWVDGHIMLFLGTTSTSSTDVESKDNNSTGGEYEKACGGWKVHDENFYLVLGRGAFGGKENIYETKFVALSLLPSRPRWFSWIATRSKTSIFYCLPKLMILLVEVLFGLELWH